MVFLELSLFRKAFRFIGAVFCDVIYTLISKVYELFITIARLNILSSDQIQPIYQRITMILTIVMVFYVTLEFVKYTISPDTISDKEKGAGNILKRIIIVVVLIALVPEIFTTAYKLQNRIIETQLISKIILGTSNSNYTTYGNDFSANMLGLFYYYDEEACSDENSGLFNDCAEAKRVVTEKLNRIRATGDSDIVEGINLASGKATFKEVNPAIKFNGILAIIVGGVMLYILILYSIDVGTRYVQLIFLQIISPIAIMGYILPKKDGIFQKWGKQCLTTYIDLFLRIAIINFVLLITKVLGDAFQNGDIFADIGEVSPGLKAFVYIALVMGLLVFAQRAPKLLSELFPSSGAAGLGFGLKGADRVAPGAARAIGAGAAGLTGLARRGVARAQSERARRNKIKEDRLAEGKPIDRKSMRDELRRDRLARKQTGDSLNERRKALEKASKDKARAERDLEAAEKTGDAGKIAAARRARDEAAARFDKLQKGNISNETKNRLNRAQQAVEEAKRTGRYDTMPIAERKKLDDELAAAKFQAIKEGNYADLKRAHIDASSRAAKTENQNMGAPIGLQVAGAALGGLATGVKTGAGATKLEDIGKKVQEADKKNQEIEVGRSTWLEAGGAATVSGVIDKKVAQTQQKWGIRTEAERIKYDIKTLESQSKGLESQATMEANVKSTKDAAKDRSADKLNKHEQKITMRDGDKIKYGKDKDGRDLYVEFKPNETTSQVLMRYEEQANTAKARAEAANAELVKAQMAGRPQSEIEMMKEKVEAMSLEAEEKRFAKEQVHKKLAEYGYTRTLENLANPGSIPDSEVDGVLANQVAASMKAVENARNSAKTVNYVKETLDGKMNRELSLATTEEEKERIKNKYNNYFKAFMDNDFRDYDTLDTIEAIITGHVGALKNERSAITETIRQINESSATDAANANAADGGKK